MRGCVGVGRSGTYIATDSIKEDIRQLLRQGKSLDQIDVDSRILKLRERRPQMVQTPGQLKLIYESLLLRFEAGDVA